jgi:hypothetical protein
MIDGVEYAGQTMVVVMGISEDHTKRILGMRQGQPRTRRSARRCRRAANAATLCYLQHCVEARITAVEARLYAK